MPRLLSFGLELTVAVPKPALLIALAAAKRRGRIGLCETGLCKTGVRHGCSRWATVLSTISLLTLTACGTEPEPPAAQQPESTVPTEAISSGSPPVAELILGTPTEDILQGGRSHTYRLDLETDAFIRVIADQIDIDVVLELFAPDDGSLIRCDKLTGRTQPEQVLWVAQEPGEHRLKITALGGDAVAGRYRVRLDQQRPATDIDRQQVTAEKLYFEGETLRRKKDPDSQLLAETKIRAAVADWQALGNRSRMAVGLYRLGLLQTDRQRAIEEFERALALLEDNSEAWLKATVLHWLGRLHFKSGDTQRAIERYQQALPLRKRAGDARGEALITNNLGVIYQALGETPRALEHYRRALASYRELKDTKEEARTLHNLGKSYLSTGLHKEALDHLNQAFNIRQQHRDIAGQASTLSAIGQAYTDQDNLDRGLEAHQQALQLSRQAGNPRLEAIALSDTAVILEALQRPEQALQLYQQALAIFSHLEDTHNTSRTLYNIGWLLAGRGDAETAIEFYDRALALLEDTQANHIRILALRGKALAERQRGHLQAARELFESALAEIEGLRSQPQSQTLRYSYFATKQSYYDAYVDLLMELHRRQPDAGFDAQALTASERARARSQLDALNESGVDLRRGADPQLRQRERVLERDIEALERQRLRWLDLSNGVRTPQVEDIEKQLREQFLEHGRVQREMRVASPQYAALTQPQPLTAADIQQHVLDRDTLLIEIDLGEERSYLWAVTPDHIHSLELPPRKVIEGLAEKAYNALSSSHLTASRVQTRLTLESLSRLLLQPIAPLLESRRLLIVAEGALQYIPFGALPIPAAPEDDPEATPSFHSSPPLSSRNEIISMPSASTLAMLRRQLSGRRTSEGKIAVLADPVFGPEDPRFRDAQATEPAASNVRGRAVPEPRSFDRLIFSRQEADDILALVPAQESLARIGFDANRNAVMSGQFSTYRFLHFATHGELNTAHPELSRLVVSQLDRAGRPIDGFIFAHELFNLELAADLVVLSACETALGTEIRGEGLLGLTQGFMYAGAASVIVSLWSVDDEATAELMALFYRKLLVEELRPAAALRAAQMMIAGDPRWQAPYYWAGFVLHGEWR